MIRNHDAHLRANLAPVIGQFGRPEEIKPDKSSFNDDIMIMLIVLNADDAGNHIHGRPEKVKPKKSNIDFATIPILYDNDAIILSYL